MLKRARGDEAGSSGASSTATLFEDVLSTIFIHLVVAERARASRVCRKWRAAALQPPYSTELTLRVRLAGDEGPSISSTSRQLQLLAAYSNDVDQPAAAADLFDAVALLRGTLCGGLRRLRLELVLPRNDIDDTRLASNASALGTIGAVGAALPSNLLALSLSMHGTALLIIKIESTFPYNVAAEDWQAVMERLDLASSAPCLEDLELKLGENTRFEALNFSHPTLKRLGASICIDGWSNNREQLANALRLLPRLEVVRSIVMTGTTDLALFADAEIWAEHVDVKKASIGKELSRVLKAGSVLSIRNCRGTLPDPDDWSLELPADLAELQLNRCLVSLSQLEFLLHRTGTYAPGLRALVIDLHTLISCSFESQLQWGLREVLTVLERAPGATQIAIRWSEIRNKHNDAFLIPAFLAPLMQALITSPNLHRFVHVHLPPAFVSILPPDVAADYAAYRRARAAALRGMGEAGRRLLVEQGYD